MKRIPIRIHTTKSRYLYNLVWIIIIIAWIAADWLNVLSNYYTRILKRLAKSGILGFTHELTFKRTNRCCLQFRWGKRTRLLLERKLESWWNYQRARSCKRKIWCKDTMVQASINNQNKKLKLKLIRFQNLVCCERFSYGRRLVISGCATHKISVVPHNLGVVSNTS